jgi:hypothetical protein
LLTPLRYRRYAATACAAAAALPPSLPPLPCRNCADTACAAACFHCRRHCRRRCHRRLLRRHCHRCAALPLPLPSLQRKQGPLLRQRRLATIATAVEGDSGGVSTAAAVGTTAAEAGGLQPRWQFATMEAEEGANTYLQIILSVQMSAQISGHASRYLVTP